METMTAEELEFKNRNYYLRELENNGLKGVCVRTIINNYLLKKYPEEKRFFWSSNDWALLKFFCYLFDAKLEDEHGIVSITVWDKTYSFIEINHEQDEMAYGRHPGIYINMYYDDEYRFNNINEYLKHLHKKVLTDFFSLEN